MVNEILSRNKASPYTFTILTMPHINSTQDVTHKVHSTSALYTLLHDIYKTVRCAETDRGVGIELDRIGAFVTEISEPLTGGGRRVERCCFGHCNTENDDGPCLEVQSDRTKPFEPFKIVN